MRNTLRTLTAVAAVMVLLCGAYGATCYAATGGDPGNGSAGASRAPAAKNKVVSPAAVTSLLPHPRIWLNQAILNRLVAAKNANSAGMGGPRELV